MGKNLNNVKDFLNMFGSIPLSMYHMEAIMEGNDVLYEMVDVYRDFTLALNKTIQETYMGDDISDLKVKKEHFDWCWRKVCSEFETIGLYFMENKYLYEYFKNFFHKTFYQITNKDSAKIVKEIESFWLNIYDYKQIKTHFDLEFFIEIYKIFKDKI